MDSRPIASDTEPRSDFLEKHPFSEIGLGNNASLVRLVSPRHP